MTTWTSGPEMMDPPAADLEEDLRRYDREDLRIEGDGTFGKQILKRTSGTVIMRTSS